MQKFDGGRLFINITGLSNLGHAIKDGIHALMIPKANHEDIKQNIQFVCDELNNLELVSSLASAKELQKIINFEVEIKLASEISEPIEGLGRSTEWAMFNPHVLGRYRHYAADLVNRFKDELSERTVVSISPRHNRYLSGPLFGDQVSDAFPNAHEDIEEAGKCLAFGRATAAVFHLMRALESATQAIGRKLDAAVQDAHGKGLPWGVIAGNMKLKIDAMQRGSDEQIKWYRVQNDLVVVNRAWRVPTNHPKENYTPDQAEEIFDATRAFMRELAPLI